MTKTIPLTAFSFAFGRPMFSKAQTICWTKIFTGLLLIPVWISAVSVAQAQSQRGTDWRVQRKALDRDLADSLQDIALWCREVGIPQQVSQTFAIFNNRDLRRQYIYLPSTKKMPADRPGKSGQWLKKVGQAKSTHAQRIFELAKLAAEAGANATAFQLLHEVIYFDRDHAQTRMILGHKDKGDSWQINRDRLKVKKNRPAHTKLQWPANSYITVITPHFTVDSTATEEQTVFLAESLEQWHDVWRQVFFDFWASTPVKRWFDKKGQFKEPKKRYEVAFYKDRAAYISDLQRKVDRIGDSTGYYNQEQQRSFFYAGDDPQIIDTWKHELTHQLFRETTRARKSPFEDQFLWLDEGIAMYFESLTDMGGYLTLGGFDAHRLQYSRIRKLREGIFIPSQELSQMSQKQIQGRQDIHAIYSQAAGMTHMLMNGDHGKQQPKINEFMKVIHKRKVKPSAFENLLGKSSQQLDLEYLKFLETSNDEVTDHLLRPELRTVMALPNAQLALSGFESVGKCERLRWLDVAGSSVSAASIAALRRCDNLQQIFMTGCQIEPAGFLNLNQLKSLTDLDLTASSVTSRDLSMIAKNKLNVLLLKRTRVSDAAVPVLSQMSALKTLDISQTSITPNGVASLQRALPGVNIIRQP